jgi:YidC/Oxa1 family membrane protein insertase
LGSDNRRLLVATVASIAIVVFWQLLFPPPKAVPSKGPEAAVALKGSTHDSGATADASKAAPIPAPAPVAVDAAEELVVLEGNGFTATVSSHGGTLASVALKGKKFVEDRAGKTQPIDLVRAPKEIVRPLALVPTKESGGTGDPWSDPAAAAPMRVVEKSAKSVTLEGQAGSLVVRKTFRVTEKAQELALDLELTGGDGKGAASLLLAGQLPGDVKTGGLTSAPSLDMFRLVCRAGEKTERLDVTGDDKGKKVPGAVSYAGLDMHYFLVAAIPASPSGECEFFRGPKPKSGLVALSVAADGTGAKKSFNLFVGPKDLDALRAYGRGLDTAIDYGPVTNLFAFFARGLLYVMRWLHAITHSWGIAIILLTFLVKGVLFPLTYKSTLSMNAMRALQPEVDKLKAKYKDDREKLQAETMQLYQKNKVNPLGGCLPMLLQMPIWFALYAALQTSVELYREQFLWMKDLTIHDPFFILPVAMGISSFAMQKLSPQPADNAQAKMMLYFFPAFFTFIMLWVPGGLTLYILVNNLLTIVQQRVIGTGAKAAAAKA